MKVKCDRYCILNSAQKYCDELQIEDLFSTYYNKFQIPMSLTYLFKRSGPWLSSIPQFVGEVNSKFNLSKFVSVTATHGHTNSESLFLYTTSDQVINQNLEGWRLGADFSISQQWQTWESYLGSEYKKLLERNKHKNILGTSITQTQSDNSYCIGIIWYAQKL